MAETLAAWLRQQREARGWSRREMARQLIQAGRAADDTSIPGMDSMCHNIHRWERGQGGLAGPHTGRAARSKRPTTLGQDRVWGRLPPRINSPVRGVASMARL